MKRRDGTGTVLVLLAAAVCLHLAFRPAATADPRKTPREIVSAVDDSASTVEARQSALDKLREAFPLFLAAGEFIEAARVLNRTGHIQLLLNKPNDAIADYLRALGLIGTSPDPQTEVDALNGLAESYFVLKQKHKVEERLQQSLSLSERSGYVRGRAQALLILSTLQNLDDHAIALETAKKSLSLWQGLADKGGTARAHFQIGECLYAQNSLADSAENYETALNLWRELNKKAEEAESLIMLGFVEFRKGEWQTCISYLLQAQGLLDERAEPRKMGQIATALAEAFNENGLPENGIIQYQRALEYYEQTQNPRSINYITWGLGWTYYLMGNFPEALNYLQRSLNGLDKDSLDAAQRYEYLGRVFVATGARTDATNYLGRALTIYSKSSNPKEAAQVRALLGQVYEQEGKTEQARQSYFRALDTFRTLTDRGNESATLYALGNLELKQNNLYVAADYLHHSIEVTENIRRVSTSSDLTAAFSATVHERYEAYIECLMRQHQAQPDAGLATRAFELSEHARARSLAELLRATQTNLASSLDPQLAAHEKSLRQSLRVKEDYKVAMLGQPYKKEDLEALERDLARLNAELEEVRKVIHARYPAYDQITQPIAWKLEDIQRQVISDDETLVLEYSLGANRSYVWAVTRDYIASYELPAETAIVGAVGKVHKWLGTTPRPGDNNQEGQNAVADLSRIVLSPVAAELNKRRIIVVADGALNYVPFQILTGTSGNPLVENFEIINAPSASILGELRREATQRRPTKLLAAFGDPVFASSYAQAKKPNSQASFAMGQENNTTLHAVLRDIELNGDQFDPSVMKPLFFAKRELANIRVASSDKDSFVASDFSATRERLLSSDLTQYSILHFATHGLLDPKRPEKSGLVLSTVDREGKELNGFVGLQDIYQLRAPVDLVVLSACQTGLGKDVRGEGLLGLTRGFMYAGASSVVASLWKVDDEATAALMKQFYENLLQKGMTPSAALREAQNTIRHRPEWSRPYFWAAFTLQGEYRNPITPKARSIAYTKPLVVGAILVLLALATVWYLRRRRSVHSTVKK